MATERIVQHKHCINCGRAQPTDQQYCSTACEQEFINLQQRKKMVLYINYGLMIVGVAILVILASN